MAGEERDLQHLRAFVRDRIEGTFGCPLDAITMSERNEWCNSNSTCKAQFDALRDALSEKVEA